MTQHDGLRKIGAGSGADEGPPPPDLRPVLEPDFRRRFTELPADSAGRRHHGHLHDRLVRLRALLFSFVGVIMGFLAGGLLAIKAGGPFAPYYPFLFGALGGVGLYGFVMLLVEKTGTAGGSVLMPSGAGASPPRREYSLAESLVASGRFEDAVSGFELAVAEHPEDPFPYLRIARIQRDHLGRPEEAERWFRRALRDATVHAGQERLVVGELVELYRKMGSPTRAAPDLARLAERRAGTPDGDWAARELAELKRLVAGQGE